MNRWCEEERLKKLLFLFFCINERASKKMADKRDIQISKALSKLLRHTAVEEKLNIDSNGFILLSDVLSHNRLKSFKTTLADIQRILANNEKQRFSIKEQDEKLYICANQGHTITSVSGEDQLCPLLAIADFPPFVIHGTFHGKLKLINETGGLSRMRRNHIHFASDSDPDKVISGMRKSCSVFIYIDFEKCLKGGIKFYRSDNGVILSAGDDEGRIPTDFFLKVVDRKGNAVAPR